MSKVKITELNSDALVERKRGNIRRYIITMGLMSLFTLYLGYLDLIKKSEFRHTETYIFIAIGILALTIEILYKTRKINRELRLRNR